MRRNIIIELNDEQLNELLSYAPNFTAQNIDNIKRKCF
jgi:hypothetical protein